jgi:hypothetical protein
MRTIEEIYESYNLLPNLREHQLRVAAVAQQIGNAMTSAVDTKGIVRTCLVHDMGNIIKFDLTFYPDFVEPLGLEYWQGVKGSFINTYGSDEHMATSAICREVGLTEKEIEYLSTIGFTRSTTARNSGSFEQMICCYADQRVGPRGVLSLDERLRDGRKRYEGREDKKLVLEQYDEFVESLYAIEQKIFVQSTIRPEDVSDSSVVPIISALRGFQFE